MGEKYLINEATFDTPDREARVLNLVKILRTLQVRGSGNFNQILTVNHSSLKDNP